MRKTDTTMRQPGETWSGWATRALEATQRELAMSRATWEANFGRWPGPGYAATLRVQAARLKRNLERYGDAPGNNVPLEGHR